MSEPATPVVIVGVNSYVSVADADALAETRLFTTHWQAATADARARALITATTLLDRMVWEGRPVIPSQPLAWPRVPERCIPGYPLSTKIPSAIVTATVELAVHLLKTGEYGGGPAVMQRMLGDAMVMHFAHVADEFPKHIRRLIEPHLRASSANVAEVRF